MKPTPPKKALRFLRWFCKEEFLEEIEGDLTEVFEKEYEKSSFRARTKFIWNVLRYFRPVFIKPVKAYSSTASVALLRHSFLLSYRKSMRYKSTFFINLVGLSTGLACAILILLWVNFELSVDKFHEKDTVLYQVIRNSTHPDGIRTSDDSPALLSKALKEEMPEVEDAVTTNNGRGMLTNGDVRVTAKGLYASSNFFTVFSYRLVQGTNTNMLKEHNAIALSESLAKSLFGSNQNIIGKFLEGNQDLLNETFVVSGVFEDPPSNSTQQFDFIINYETLLKRVSWKNDWNGDGSKTFIALKKGVNIDQFNEKIEPYLTSKADRATTSLFIQQFSKKYLYGNYENGQAVAGKIIYVRLFGLVALFILCIACINFMNLSTAQASRKMKEIGVKKAIGADKIGLALQFMVEAIIITSLAMLIAFLLVELLLPYFSGIIGTPLHINYTPNLLLNILVITLILGIVSGSYPAFYLSNFNPIIVLKGKIDHSFGEKWIRKGLVVVQFTISVIFITGFLIIHQQIDFVQSKDVGYSKDNVMHFQIRGNQNRETFIQTLADIPGVIHATNAQSGSIVSIKGAGRGFSWEGMRPDQNITFLRPQVGYGFIETLGIELIEGRSFSREYGNEDSKLLINEATATMIGTENIVGRVVMDGDIKKEIIGIVKNFNTGSLHEKLRPAFIRFSPNGRNIMVKLNEKNVNEIISKIETVYKQFNPEYPFSFTFIDDEYQSQYLFEERIGTLSKYFTILAIIISCLGLFGLSTFTMERRTKEIGIRKVLGASSLSIVRLLSSDFTRLVFVAIIIATPISYMLATGWLESFAYSIELKWWIFAGAGIGAMIVTWITISFQSIKAALFEPTKCIMSE